ncbi:MAG: zinc ribbon domain-containing protein [Candidatus Peribacter sp.]|nr:zinc ribbon domain-containing protein [Candidatus Peribacter sp.]
MGNPLELTIPGSWKNKQLIISDTDIACGSTRILIRDLSRISYHSTTTRTSVYFVPVNTSTSSSFLIGTDSEAISFSIPGHGKEPNEVFHKLFYLSKNIFEPIIVKRLFSTILAGDTVKIGSISLNKEGFQKKTFFGGVVAIPWNRYAGIVLHLAVVHVWYLTEKSVKKEFIAIPLATTNAAVLDVLLGLCHSEFGKYAARGVRVCTSCGKETESDGKFCQHCGASLSPKN